MAHSILIFDFGTNEEAAQQAKHKIESWKQGFRLGNKISLKFERTESDSEADDSQSAAAKKGHAEKKKASSKADKSEQSKEAGGDVKILVRLDFSDHEKLSYQRWLDRIPGEEPFKSAAKSETTREGDASYAAVAERFESLD